jgi:hypothetical protein
MKKQMYKKYVGTESRLSSVARHVAESSAKKLKCSRRKNEVAGEIDGRNLK